MSVAETTDLGRVEQMLREARGGERIGSVRAITLNLVVHAPTAAAAADVVEMLERIGPSHPLRAIVATPADGGLRATVQTSCWIGSADRQVCSERVLVEAEQDALPSAVMSLLVPDLPVFLLWHGALEPRAVLEDLAALADRLVVDSGDCGLDAVESACLLSPSLTDLAWASLLPWREAVAALFDGAAPVKALQRLRTVELRGPENEARLLAGWLRSRLEGEIEVGVEGGGRHLERVALVCGRDVYAVERPGRARVGTAGGPDVPEHPVVLAPPARPAILAEELSRLSSDPAFERALALA